MICKMDPETKHFISRCNERLFSASTLVIAVIVLMGVSTIGANSVFGQTEDEGSANNEQSQIVELLTSIGPISAATIAVVGSAYVGPKITKTWKERERQTELNQKELELKNKFVTEISHYFMSTIVTIMKVEECLNILYGDQDKSNENKNNSSDMQNKLSKLRDDRDDEYRKFLVRGHIIQSKIQAYFNEHLRECGTHDKYVPCECSIPSSKIPQDNNICLLCEWNEIMDFVKFIHHLSAKENFNARQKYIEQPEQLERKKILVLLKLAREKYYRLHELESKKGQISEGKFKVMLFNMNIEAWYELKHAIVDKKDEVIKTIINTEIALFHEGKKDSAKDNKSKRENIFTRLISNTKTRDPFPRKHVHAQKPKGGYPLHIQT